jgi:hypothetical protein
MVRMTLALAALIGIAAPAEANLVVNGGFELPGGIQRTTLTNGLIPGWTYDSHGTGFEIYEDDSQDGLAAADGSHYVSFGHSGAYGGELSQTIPTIAGHSYRLSLATAEQQGGDDSQQFYVLLTTSVGNSYGFYIGNLGTGFATTVQDFFPNGVSTTISIMDATPAGSGGSSNLALDAVSVIDLSDANGGVPEPGIWAMLLGGFGLVGATARSRRTRSAVVTA